jgi:F-type H+-transporting ATPase subunit delta
MKDSVLTAQVIEPYAQALMSLAKSQDLTNRFGEDVASLLGLLHDSGDLAQFLANPLLDPNCKKAVLQQIAGDQLHPYLRNFLLVLVDRRRIGFLEGICKQYQALLRELNQTVLAEVSSSVPLTDTQQHAIREKVISMTGARQVELDSRIDPDLIGGVVIKVGSQVIDASLRGQLRRISLRLSRSA